MHEFVPDKTSTVQQGYFFLFKETKGAFDEVQIHAWQTSTDFESDALTIAQRLSSDLDVLYYGVKCFIRKNKPFKTVLKQNNCEILVN